MHSHTHLAPPCLRYESHNTLLHVGRIHSAASCYINTSILYIYIYLLAHNIYIYNMYIHYVYKALVHVWRMHTARRY